MPAVRKILGKSDYRAHEGINSGGANAVFWVETIEKRNDGLVVVRNVTEKAKRKVPDVVKPVEPDLLYPLLKASDVRRWKSKPVLSIIVTHKPGMRLNAIPLREMQEKLPRTYAYLKAFEPMLRERGGWEVKQAMAAGKPFYCMSEVGDYTFAPWRVGWPNIATELCAAVISEVGGRLVIPQHIVTLVACDCEVEAHYLCATVNSSPVNYAAKAYSQEGGKSFGDPHLLEHIGIPKFDPNDKVHKQLAELSMQAHEVAKKGDEKVVAGIEAQVDLESAKLWNLSTSDLAEIQRSLRELAE